MIPIISIVGGSNAGKTVLIEKLIPEMKRRGYRVATIKHDVHTFDIDKEGKDSWRHAQAGAEVVAISSPSKFAMVRKTTKEMSLDRIANSFIDDVDVIITEGYKSGVYPKIEVFRHKEGKNELLCQDNNDNLVAIVSDKALGKDMPCFGFDDTVELVDFLEKEFITAKDESLPSVRLRVDGKEISTRGFVRKIIAKTVLGMISSLRGTEHAKRISIEIEVERR